MSDLSDGRRREAVALWTALDPDGPPRVVWPRRPRTSRVAVLMGAFDPPTNAHLAILDAAARIDDASPAFCMTKVLLARPDDELLAPEQRIDVLFGLAERRNTGLGLANRGTFLDVGRALQTDGVDATFVVGADKIAQLADPSFYANGIEGVRATFEDLRFVVVPRGDVDLARVLPAGDLRVLDTSEVFTDDATAGLSSTDVRRSHRAGSPVDRLVPPEVDLALRGYTSAR